MLTLILSVIGCYVAGSLLSAPARRVIGPPPSDLQARLVEFDGVKGWFVSAGESAPCVLLMHGVRADRRSMIGRARLLRQAGYSSLLFDFQAHGESPGDNITFGYRESENARAAVTVLKKNFNCTKVAAVGVSLGGAAALLGAGPIDVDALVLESVYPSMDEALSDRLQIYAGRFGSALAPLLSLQLRPRIGIDPQDLQPIRHIGRFHRPVLIIHGADDQHTRLEEAARMFAAANDYKEFWVVPDAAHVDFQRFSPTAYQERLLNFLSRSLRATEISMPPTLKIAAVKP